MLDLILDLLGATLFVGQAVYFLVFSENWTVPDRSAQSMIPAAGIDADGADGFEMGARHR